MSKKKASTARRKARSAPPLGLAIPFEDNKGNVMQLDGKLTIADLVKMGAKEIRLMPEGSPLPDNWWSKLMENPNVTEPAHQNSDSHSRDASCSGLLCTTHRLATENEQRKAVQEKSIAEMLVEHCLIDAGAIDDPSGYDAYMTVDRVAAFTRALNEILFPNDKGEPREGARK